MLDVEAGPCTMDHVVQAVVQGVDDMLSCLSHQGLEDASDLLYQ